jgi:hypothetical protein
MADITLMEQALANVSTLSNVSTTVGDFNSDGLVTNADLQGMLTALKNGQGNTSTVPEPSSIALVSVAGIALMLIGKRGGRWRA